MSFSANFHICVNFSCFQLTIFLLVVGHIYWLLSIFCRLSLDARCCKFCLVGYWIFLYSLSLSSSSFFFDRPMTYGVPRPGIRSEPQLHCRILNPLCWVSYWTCIAVLQRYHQSCCTTAETPIFVFL